MDFLSTFRTSSNMLFCWLSSKLPTLSTEKKTLSYLVLLNLFFPLWKFQVSSLKGPKKPNGKMKVWLDALQDWQARKLPSLSHQWFAGAPFLQKMGERGKHCNVSKCVFFHGFLGPEGHRGEAKTHICVRAEGTGILQMALLRRTAWWRQELTREIAGRCCPIGPSGGATLDMAGAALDSFEAASPCDMVLCLLLPAGHNINLSLALLQKVAGCKLECQTRHPLYEENRGHCDGRSSCVVEHEGNHISKLIHNSLSSTLHGSKAVCKRNVQGWVRRSKQDQWWLCQVGCTQLFVCQVDTPESPIQG